MKLCHEWAAAFGFEGFSTMLLCIEDHPHKTTNRRLFIALNGTKWNKGLLELEVGKS